MTEEDFIQLNVFGDILALGIGYAMTKTCFAYGLWWYMFDNLDHPNVATAMIVSLFCALVSSFGS